MPLPNTTEEVQLTLAQALDSVCPVDVRSEEDCRTARVEHAARFAIREARALGLDQTKALVILARLWRER